MPNVKTYPDISWIENKEELGEVSDLLLNMKYLERNCVGLSVGGDLYKDYCYLEFSEDEKKADNANKTISIKNCVATLGSKKSTPFT